MLHSGGGGGAHASDKRLRRIQEPSLLHQNVVSRIKKMWKHRLQVIVITKTCENTGNKSFSPPTYALEGTKIAWLKKDTIYKINKWWIFLFFTCRGNKCFEKMEKVSQHQAIVRQKITCHEQPKISRKAAINTIEKMFLCFPSFFHFSFSFFFLGGARVCRVKRHREKRKIADPIVGVSEHSLDYWEFDQRKPYHSGASSLALAFGPILAPRSASAGAGTSWKRATGSSRTCAGRRPRGAAHRRGAQGPSPGRKDTIE